MLLPTPDQQEVALVLWRRSRLDGVDCIVSVQMGGQAAPFPRGAACSLSWPPALGRVRVTDSLIIVAGMRLFELRQVICGMDGACGCAVR